MRCIDLALLKSKGACVGSLATFRELFDDTAPELTDENALKYANKFDWEWASCELLTQANRAAYKKVCAQAKAEYDKVCAPAKVEYDKVRAPAWAEYNKVCAAALAEYDKVCALVKAEYDKVCAPAWAEYDKVCAPAKAEYDKVCAVTFVQLYRNQPEVV